ncbi:MAG TPA: condensation domain-containing protein [Ruminiclostridium sp.]|nr:condensation domain-containing protein [Ruminiclostridium sp.]
MTIDLLMKNLRRLGVEIVAGEDNTLHCNAPKGALTKAIKEEISSHKEEIIEYMLCRSPIRSLKSQRLRINPDEDLQSKLSYLQERLCFLEEMESNSSAYNITYALKINGAVNLQALKQSLNEIVRRHEILRTKFKEDNGKRYQSVSKTWELEFTVRDLNGTDDIEETVHMYVVDESNRVFSKSNDLFLRTTVLYINEIESVLILTTHHLAADGWSMNILVNELCTSYHAHVNGTTPILPELPIQYSDYAEWQRNWEKSDQFKEQLNYWKKKLENCGFVLDIPADFSRPAVQKYKGREYKISIHKRLSESVKALSSRYGCTLYMTLMSVFQLLLHNYSGQNDLIVATAISNRTRTETEFLIGPFSNNILIRTMFKGEDRFCDILKQVCDTVVEAYANQDIPFDKLVEELNPVRDMSRHPLFQVMFILQNTPMDSVSLPGLELKSLRVDGGSAKFDLTLELYESQEGIEGWIEYNTDLFAEGTIARMAGHFITLLENIAAAPEKKISALSMLDEKEYRRIVTKWNDTEAEYPEEACIHGLFGIQARKTPDTAAVIYGGEKWTYGELDIYSNKIGNSLRKLGIGKETPVGICMERSPMAVACMLGIMKAGGAYVPLDPAYPKDRLEYIVRDAGLSVVLSGNESRDMLKSCGVVFHPAFYPFLAFVQLKGKVKLG